MTSFLENAKLAIKKTRKETAASKTSVLFTPNTQKNKPRAMSPSRDASLSLGRQATTQDSQNKTNKIMVLFLTIGVALFCAFWTLCHLPDKDALGVADDKREKLREFLVLDIRANSQYCAWYVTLIGVIGTIVASNKAPFQAVLASEYLWPFGVSFLAASLATLFFPAGYGQKHLANLKWVWLRSVWCEQVVVIFTSYGIWETFCVLTRP